MDITARNAVHVIGPQEGSVVMLAHGLGCDQRFWRGLCARLSRHYRVVLFDYVGSGNSQRGAYCPDRYGRLEGYRDDLLEVRATLGGSPVHLVGHSISSMIGMLAILSKPEQFSDLVMLAPSPRFLNDAATGYVGGFEPGDIDSYLEVMERNFIGWASAFSQLAAGPDQQIARELYESFCSTDPRTIRTFANLTLRVDCRALLPQLKRPALVLQCKRDPLAPLSVGQYLRNHLPKVDYRELDVTGHCPHMTHPDLVAQSLYSFWGRPWL